MRESRTWGAARWRWALWQLAVLGAAGAAFWWLHNLAGTDLARATANAEAFQSVERSWGLDVEVSANDWLVASPPLSAVAVTFYRLYYLPLAAVLLWLILRHADAYRRVRTALAVTAALALVVFWALPVSPPRFALPGIVDVVARHDPVAGAASRDLSNGQNHLSAFPSLHVGWAALTAYAAWLALRPRHRIGALAVWLYPALMVGVVLTTGNHYVLDVLGTAALITIALSCATALDRRARSR